jgi:hypothetical protein
VEEAQGARGEDLDRGRRCADRRKLSERQKAIRGRKLAGDFRWAKAQAKAKKDKAGDVWQRVIEPAARHVLEQRPGIKVYPAAKLVRALVDRELGDDCPSVSTIRQKISKLRKNI